jgi:hypothetical protein
MPLGKGRYPAYNLDWIRAGSPAGQYRESVPRPLAGADVAIAATGVELSVGIPLVPGDVVTSITFVTGGTAAATPTAGYACLRTPAGALLAQTADFGSTARAANTAFTVALATPQLITAEGLYRVGLSFTAGTIPTLRGVALNNAVLAGALGVGAAVLARSHGSSVGAVAPATEVTPTTTATVPLLIVT